MANNGISWSFNDSSKRNKKWSWELVDYNSDSQLVTGGHQWLTMVYKCTNMYYNDHVQITKLCMYIYIYIYIYTHKNP